jgi:hypothetical protein
MTPMGLANAATDVFVPDGWHPETWAGYLREKARRCAQEHPGLADGYIAWARRIEEAERRKRDRGKRVYGADRPIKAPRFFSTS